MWEEVPEDERTRMRVGGVVVDPTTGTPVLVLRGIEDPSLYLPIAIGRSEAASIATHLAGVESPRPMTHDLMLSLIETLECELDSVLVTHVEGVSFFARLEMTDPYDDSVTLDARPSDAVAVALRSSCPVFVTNALLAEVGKRSASIPPEADETVPAPGRAMQISRPKTQPSPEVRLEDLYPEDFGQYTM